MYNIIMRTRIRNNKTVRVCGRGIKNIEQKDGTPFTNLEKLKNDLKNITMDSEKKLSFISL